MSILCGSMDVFFSDQADLEWISENFWQHNFSRYILMDRILKLGPSQFHDGCSGLQFHVYRAPLAPIPFCVPYDAVIWIKDGEGKILWQNRNYNEDGSLKGEEK